MTAGALDLAAWDELPADARYPLAGVLIAGLRRTTERTYRTDAALDRALAAAVRSWLDELPYLAQLLDADVVRSWLVDGPPP